MITCSKVSVLHLLPRRLIPQSRGEATDPLRWAVSATRAPQAVADSPALESSSGPGPSSCPGLSSGSLPSPVAVFLVIKGDTDCLRLSACAEPGPGLFDKLLFPSLRQGF